MLLQIAEKISIPDHTIFDYFSQALAELYREGKVSREMAFTRCVSQPELERLLGKSITSRKV
jgi:Tfp pilus assembly ATPase PilU